jgi:hypothetical protein
MVVKLLLFSVTMVEVANKENLVKSHTVCIDMYVSNSQHILLTESVLVQITDVKFCTSYNISMSFLWIDEI